MVLDSNIIIYSADDQYQKLRIFIKDKTSTVSIITQIEVLGYKGLTVKDKRYFEAVFQYTVPLEDSIVERAIMLRQQHN